MSRTSDLLLIGSFAAALRGILPAWRNGWVGDVDFVATRAGAERLMAQFGWRLIEHAPDRCYCADRDGGMNLDVDLRGHLIDEVSRFAEPATVVINGRHVHCLLSKPELIVALRSVSRTLVPTAIDKADRDMAEYAQIELESALISLAMTFRKPNRNPTMENVNA